MDIDIARKDEIPQEFTSEQIANIKANMPTQTANVFILNQVYSPEETKVGVWREYRTVEGQQVLMQKPVYQSRGDFTSPSSSDWGNTGLAINQIERTVSSYYDINMGDGNTVIMPNDSMIRVNISSNVGNVQFTTSYNSRKNKSMNIIIQYTKTTDEWEVVE